MTGADLLFVAFAFACSFLFNQPQKKEKEKTEAEKLGDLVKYYFTEGIPVKVISCDKKCDKSSEGS